MSVHMLVGDSFLTTESLVLMRRSIAPPDLLEANSHYMSSAEITLGQLKSMCDTLPFLAQNRLVVVEGLLETFETQTARRGRKRRYSTGNLPGWDGLESYFERMPPTTILVFKDKTVKSTNALFVRLKQFAQIENLPTPKGSELIRWVSDRIKLKGSKISVAGLRLLVQHIGSNLWALDTELEKLALYAHDGMVSEDDVRILVPLVKEASIFTAVDAILEGRSSQALQLLSRLRSGGAEFPYILTMLNRQLRLIALAKDLLARGVNRPEIGPRLDIKAEFILKKTLGQAKKFSWDGLADFYQLLARSDLAIKEGRLNEDIALDLMVAEMASIR